MGDNYRVLIDGGAIADHLPNALVDVSDPDFGTLGEGEFSDSTSIVVQKGQALPVSFDSMLDSWGANGAVPQGQVQNNSHFTWTLTMTIAANP